MDNKIASGLGEPEANLLAGRLRQRGISASVVQDDDLMGALGTRASSHFAVLVPAAQVPLAAKAMKPIERPASETIPRRKR